MIKASTKQEREITEMESQEREVNHSLLYTHRERRKIYFVLFYFYDSYPWAINR